MEFNIKIRDLNITTFALINRATSNAVLISLTLAVALPLLTVILSLSTGGSALWIRLFATTLPSYVANSLGLMLMTGVLACLIGVSAAWCITMLDFPGRKTLSWLLILPLASPAYIIGYVYVDLIDYYGPLQSALRHIPLWETGEHRLPSIRNIYGAAYVLAIVLYPYIYLMARAAFRAQSTAQWHAARSLGQNSWQAFRSVAIPMARPAIIGGLALVLMETLADFGVADYFGVPTFSTGIFRSWLAEGDKAAAMKLAAIMLLFVFLLIAVERYSRKGHSADTGQSRAQDGLVKLSRPASYTVALLCSLPVLLGFVIPSARLLYNTLASYDPQVFAAFWTYCANSLKVSFIVAALTVSLGALFAYQQRRMTSDYGKALIRLCTLGYALPGALLAIGLLMPLGSIDRALTLWLRQIFDPNMGLILSGSLIILIYALIIRFLTISFNTISAGLETIAPNMDTAARSLGARPAAVFTRIHIPMLRSSLLTGGLLVFIDVLRELPATLILRPFNFDTLATRVYWLASDEQLAQASSAALLIILFGLLPVILLNRSIDKRA